MVDDHGRRTSTSDRTLLNGLVECWHQQGVCDADAALRAVTVLAAHFQLALLTWDRTAVTPFLGTVSGRPRRLTDDEWDRVRSTTAWADLAATTVDQEAVGEVVVAAIRRACLECASCTAALLVPPAQSLGHCEPCRARIGLDTILATGWPANGYHPHLASTMAGVPASGWWRPGAGDTCRECGIRIRLRPQRRSIPPAQVTAADQWVWVATSFTEAPTP